MVDQGGPASLRIVRLVVLVGKAMPELMQGGIALVQMDCPTDQWGTPGPTPAASIPRPSIWIRRFSNERRMDNRF